MNTEVIEPTTTPNRELIKSMAKYAGIALAAGVGLNFAGGLSVAFAAQTDADIASFAIILEGVAVNAYKGGAPLLTDPAVLAAATKFLGQHQQHHDALVAALKNLGGTPPQEPAASSLHFPKLSNQTDVLNFALALENVAVGAYAGAIKNFQNVNLIQTLASIFGVEAKHVAILRSVLGQDPLPDSFVMGASDADVQSTAAQILGTNAAPAAVPGGMPKTGGGWGAAA